MRTLLACLLLLVSAPVAAQDAPVTDRTRQLFPQTRGWFRIVETLRFDRDPGGRLTPDYATLTHPRVRRIDGAGHSLLPSFAPRFGGPMRIAAVQRPGFHVEVTPIGARDVPVRVERGLIVYADAWPDTDAIYKATPTHTDEYFVVRSARAPLRWRFVVRLGPRAAEVRAVGEALEIRDAEGVAWIRAATPFAIDATGRRVDGTLRLQGNIVELAIDPTGLRAPILVDPDWSSTGDMAYGRFYHQANVLPDGRVLQTGGCSASICSGDLTLPACRTVVRAAETLDLGTRTFSRFGDAHDLRYFHVAESLASGDVLLAGGCAESTCRATVASAEVVIWREGRFRDVTPLGEARAGMSSAVLADGRVLVAGGCTLDECTTLAEAFDPATSAFVPLARMNRARARAATVVLRDGRVLVAGGCTSIDCRTVLADAEVYDPVANRWTLLPPLSVPRGGHFAVVLLDGRVLVGGGCAEQACTTILGSTEVFDPRMVTWSAGPALALPRFGAAATRMPDGSVMVSQGCQGRAACDLSNERIAADASSMGRIEDAVTARAFHTLTFHPMARTMIASGGCQPGTCSWWVETYDVSHLRPPPGMDAGPPFPDAGPWRDAGPTARLDAGRPAPRDAGPLPSRGDGGGCGCTVPAAPHPPPALLLAIVAAACILTRRRR